MKIDPAGPYVLVIEYVTPVNRSALQTIEYDTEPSEEVYDSSPRATITVRFQSGDGPEYNAIANLNDCPYTAPCRQVIVDDISKIYTFNVHDPNNVIYLNVSKDLFM